ncbi:MAG TPA: serine/threonine-protein kinase [Actinocrinis sp.]|nr:serine/threonine-protein kinase [Actinocrinis sp.]
MSAWGIDRQMIDGRFELLEQLGGGGMGMVWRARDTMLEREVALKEVRHSGAGGPGDGSAAEQLMRERVLREARALARLHHPNVVTIHQIVDTPGLPYPWLVMELVSGGSLADRLEAGPLAPLDAARVGRGVLGALRAAHAAGIQHRDVKPANVLLRPDGSPVLTDFGIAALQETTALTATGSLIGSPEYIAPERVRGEEGNPASDLWSLGMLLYVAVEGHNPLRRATSIATLAAVLDQPIPEPPHAGALGPVLAALLVRDPAARPDAEALDRMLAAAEAGWTGQHAPLQPPPLQPPPPYQDPDQYQYQHQYAQPLGQTSAWPPADAPPNGTATLARRGRRRSVFAAYIAGTAAVGVIGALVWTLNTPDTPSSHGAPPTNGAHASTSGTGAAPAASGSPASTGSGTGDAGSDTNTSGSGASQTLLTAAGMHTLIGQMHSALGTTIVTEADLYPDHASLWVPETKDHNLIDEWDVEGGVFSSPIPWGTMDTADGTVDMNSVDWGAVPHLLGEVDAKTGTPNPTMHYVILDPDFLGDGPTLRVYSANDHGAGYLLTDLKGNIIKVYTFS